ncbi:hypothetical protein ACFL27_04650 [candidate division CSSED10-310 bacterium]|uniref:Uncharacterized protein n=1 Tax=candidate division CSSED10-310 bacterium TaxID=2855610 RepID=A0ABV6YTH6_UNCC1
MIDVGHTGLIKVPGKIRLKAETKDKPATPRITPDNQITLLQNGEMHFPTIEAAIDRAVHEIFLESYIFETDSTGHRITESPSGCLLQAR